MFKQNKAKYSIVAVLVLFITFFYCCTGPLAVEVLPPDAKSVGCIGDVADTLQPSEFNGWFASGSVSPNGVVNPANSVLFADRPNMTFYKWAEQMFLWLTSPAPPSYGGGGNLIFNSKAFFDVSPPDNTFTRHFIPHESGFIRTLDIRSINRGLLDLPIVVERKTLKSFEVLPPVLAPNGKQLVLDKNDVETEVAEIRKEKNGPAVLIDTKGKVIEGPKAILASKQNKTVPAFMKTMEKMTRLEQFDRGSLVQKISVNKVAIFLDLFGHVVEMEQGEADGNVLMAQNHSLVYYSLTVNNVYMLYRTMQGASVPANTKFPLTQANLDAISVFAASHGRQPIIDSQALAVEIKAAWIIADSLPNSSTFIKMKGEVPIYNMTDPNNWIKTGTQKVTLALVGMHVVGSTGSINPSNPNHGHPEMLWATFEHQSNCPSASYTYNKRPSGTGSIAQNTVGNWVFCQSGSAGPFNEPHISASGSDLVSVSPATISPSNILRTMPFGIEGSNSCSNAQIISLNNTVRGLLDTADIRRNYIHIGTTWTIFGASPTGNGSTSFGNQVGTNKLANTTMETFAQGTNCFSSPCHRTNTVDVSHIFSSTDPLFAP